MDYAGRLRAVQVAMQEQDIDLMFLPRAANLFYVAGIRRQLEHGTDHNAYGDWLSGGYLGQEGPIQLVARLQNALRVSLLESSAEGALNFNVELVITNKLKNQALDTAETSQYFVCLPGRKAKGGYRQELTLLAETDILAYAETVAAWGRYGGAVGDTDQFRRCATA